MRACLFILVLLTACGESEGGGVSDVLALEGDAAAGEQHFTTCTSTACHGADGNSGDGPKLAEAVPDQSEEELARIVKYGVDDMPGSTRSDQEIADLLAHLRQRFP